jgi:hypothetical protein
MRFSHKVQKILEDSGWSDGRSVAPDRKGNYPFFDIQKKILTEFDGIVAGEMSEGVEQATSKIEVGLRYCLGFEKDVKKASDALGIRLSPLARIDEGHAYLLIDERGCIYYWFDEPVKLSDTFDDALEKLLLGLK